MYWKLKQYNFVNLGILQSAVLNHISVTPILSKSRFRINFSRKNPKNLTVNPFKITLKIQT